MTIINGASVTLILYIARALTTPELPIKYGIAAVFVPTCDTQIKKS